MEQAVHEAAAHDVAVPAPGPFTGAYSPTARAIAARCEPRVNELARQITRETYTVLPQYRRLPQDMKDIEIASTVRYGLRLFLQRIDGTARSDDPDAYEPFRERAAQRAGEGVPLHVLLRTHLMGRRILWDALCAQARPGEEAALAELADALISTQEDLIGEVTQSYTHEQAALEAEQREERRGLVRDLLRGRPVSAADIEDLGLDQRALVLALRLDPGTPPEDSPVARRRRLRRLHATVESVLGPQVLVLLEGQGGHVIVPRARVGDLPGDLAQQLSRSLVCPMHITLYEATGSAEIAHAARTATEILGIVRALGRPPGLYRLQDVLLEYHLSRPGPSSTALAAMLDPVFEQPTLIATLRTYLAQRQDRRATARILGTHPNTVDNRISRIGHLVGADLTEPDGYALALAALTARELPSAESRPAAEGSDTP